MSAWAGVGVVGITTGNVLLLAAILYDLYALAAPDGTPFPVPGVLIWWLILLAIGIRKDRPRPEELDESVELVPWDASWPARFEEEGRRLADTLSMPLDAFVHIGSTSVPELIAKPVIDIMLGVPGRLFLRLRGERAFNLHIVEQGGKHWTNNHLLRQLLRNDAMAREKYAAAKRAALEQGAARLLAYSAAKNEVVIELLAVARPR